MIDELGHLHSQVMEKWLVTGARGFLGTNAGVFLRDRAEIIGQARIAVPSPHYGDLVGIDLRDADAIGAFIRDLAPDVVLHGAAISGHETCAKDPEQAHAVNVVATAAIARACSDVGARLVHISTDAIFAGDLGDYREDDPPAPFSYYGETNLAGEEEVRAALEDHLIVRTNFFGWSETGRKSILEFFVNSLREGQAVLGYPDFIVTSIYVQALLQAIWDLDEIAAIGTVHLVSSDARSKYDFGVGVAEQFGLDAGLIARQGPPADAHATSRSRNLSLNTDRAAGLLGTRMQTQLEGIAQAYDDESAIVPAIRAA
jgi:dTDP-4-dehydrorhamnose reductase